jgi:hypothetical protein
MSDEEIERACWDNWTDHFGGYPIGDQVGTWFQAFNRGAKWALAKFSVDTRTDQTVDVVAKWEKAEPANTIQFTDPKISKLEEQLRVAREALIEITEMSIHKEAAQSKKGIFRDWRDIARDALKAIEGKK